MKNRTLLSLAFAAALVGGSLAGCGDDGDNGGGAGETGSGGSGTAGDTGSGGGDTDPDELDCAAVCEATADADCLGDYDASVCAALCGLSAAGCQTEEAALLACSDDPPVVTCETEDALAAAGCDAYELPLWLSCIRDVSGGDGGAGGGGGVGGATP